MYKKALIKTALILKVSFFSFWFSSYAQQTTGLINERLAIEKNKNGWSQADIADYVINDQYADQQTGLTYVYIQQRHHGIIVYNAISNMLIRDNQVIHFTPGFIGHLGEKVKTDKPQITADAAIGYALKHLGSKEQFQFKLLGTDDSKRKYSFDALEISSGPVIVQLVYRSTEDGIFLSWDVSLEMKHEPHWWNIRVNALTGDIIDKNDYTVECNFGHVACEELSERHDQDEKSLAAPVPLPLPPAPVPAEYTVFPYPVEAPSFGGIALLSNPSDNTASPHGWHDVDGLTGADYTITRGNNVNAYEDANNDNLPGYSPSSATLQFNFPYISGAAPLTNQDMAITNLFYANNRLHDVTYHAGFTEVAGNFQQNNYGNGGLGNDYVKAEAFDGGGTNNANFSTPPDGSSGRMQMYLWSGSPQLDGSLDNGVIAHEFGHGLSNRLTGGPANTSCLSHAEQGGEGWSDWLALMMSVEPGDTGVNFLFQARGIGTYVKGQTTTGAGIRRYRYSPDMTINPQTYADLATSSGSHQKGEIWCDAIWDMSCFLIKDFGFNSDPMVTTSGNYIAMRLVLEGMKLQPCSPGYLDARDAILAADAVLYGNAHRCRIWEAFARRGMGYNAVQGSSSSSTDQTAGFAMPPFCLIPTQPPLAAFTSSLDSVSCGGSVQFYDQSVQAYGWLWSFGDQITSSLQNPIHTYTSPGTYTVKLVATNPLGSDSVTHTIIVTSSYNATVTVTPGAVCIGSQVQLAAVASGSSSISYSVTGIPYAPVSGAGTVVTLTDDVMSTVKPIGFNFSFYGQNYSNFYISSNGFITFSSGQPAIPVYGQVIPSAAAPNNFIALAWNDLDPSKVGSSITYFNTGVSPNKKLVVSYNTWHYGSGTTYPFIIQAILSEGSNEIEIHTTTISNASAFDPGAVTTQGIENANGTAGVFVPGRNAAIFSASNDAYRFVPYTPYVYTWMPGNLSGPSQTVVPLTSGTYIVSIADGSGCVSAFTSPLVTVNDLPSPVISGNSEFCSGDSTELDAGVFAGYSWSTGATSRSILVDTAGIYSVTVTDANGCTGSTTLTALVNPVPSPVITGILSFCDGDSTELDAGLFSGYVWSTGESTQSVSVNTPGTYTVSVIDFHGCSGLDSVSVVVNANPVPVITGNLLFCEGSSTILDAGPYSGFNWSTGETTQSVSVNAASAYSVTVTDFNGCSGSGSVIATTMECCGITMSGITSMVLCHGENQGSIDVSASNISGSASYLWNDGSTTEDRMGLVAGTYTVTVTFGPDCFQSQVFSITQPEQLTAYGVKTNILCKGKNTGSIILSPTGGASPYTYLWNNGKTSQSRNLLSAGAYTVTVTDGNSCTATAVFLITQPSVTLVITTSKKNVRCANGLTGTATVNVTGGVSPYTYSWNTIPVKTTSSVSGLGAGVYTCIVTDAGGCVKSVTITLTQPVSIAVVQSQTNVSIFGGNDGSASVTASGGTPGYTYSWNTIPVNTNASISGLTAGIYKCTIKDSKNCQLKVTFTITQPAARDQIVNGHHTDELKLTIFPNPNNGQMKVRILSPSFTDDIDFSLYDISGRILFNQVIHWRDKEEMLFDFSEQARGVYYIKCITDRRSVIQRVVIQ